MRILVITDKLYPDEIGGSCTYCYHTSIGLSKLGHKVDIFTGYPDKKNNNNYFGKINLYRYLDKKRIFNSSKKLSEIINENNYDSLIFHSIIGWLIYSLIRKKLSKRHKEMAIFHGPWSKEAKLKFISKRDYLKLLIVPIMRLIEYRYARQLNNYIVLSNYMKEELKQMNKSTRNKKYKIIPGGVNLDEYTRLYTKQEARAKLNIDNDEIVLFSLRRLDIRMGLQNAINALDKINIHSKKVTFFIGGKGPYESELKKKAEKLKKSRCIFTGFIPEQELNQYFCAADLFLIPSLDLEGFGLVILESLAMGLPVLVTPQGGMKEMEGKLENYYITNGFNPNDISRKIEEIYANNKFKVTYDYKLLKYDWLEITKQIEAFIYGGGLEVTDGEPISLYSNVKL